MSSNYIPPEIAAGNVKKAADLFERHGDFLLKIFRREVPGQDAYDLWQNLFLSVAANPVSSDQQNIRGYLYRAAMNDIIDYKRCLQLHKDRIDEYSQSGSIREEISTWGPEDQVATMELLRQIQKKIEATFPPTIGQAVINKYVNRMSRRQIADKMNIKLKTVERYLSVGTKMLEKLQDQIAGEKHEEA